jgi:hypothetical protein
MSPIEPRVGVPFLRALRRMQTIGSLEALQKAIYFAANNRYSSFELRGRLRFGILDRASNPDWAGRPAIYFAFVELGGSFFFTHAQEQPYEEADKQARALLAKSVR